MQDIDLMEVQNLDNILPVTSSPLVVDSERIGWKSMRKKKRVAAMRKELPNENMSGIKKKRVVKKKLRVKVIERENVKDKFRNIAKAIRSCGSRKNSPEPTPISQSPDREGTDNDDTEKPGAGAAQYSLGIN